MRVVLFEKREDALNAAVLFAKYISRRIASVPHAALRHREPMKTEHSRQSRIPRGEQENEKVGK